MLNVARISIARAFAAGVAFACVFGSGPAAAGGDLKQDYVPFSWSGFYAGLHAGAGWADADHAISGSPFWATGPGGSGVFSQELEGLIIGGQFGYNFSTGRWVYGIEATLSGGGTFYDHRSVSPFFPGVIVGPSMLTGPRQLLADLATHLIERSSTPRAATPARRSSCASLIGSFLSLARVSRADVTRARRPGTTAGPSAPASNTRSGEISSLALSTTTSTLGEKAILAQQQQGRPALARCSSMTAWTSKFTPSPLG